MKTLTVQVLGGLGSRLRAVLGAYAYCRYDGRQLRVHWPRQFPRHKHDFAARLSDLWIYPGEDFEEGPPRMRTNWDPSDNMEIRTCHPHIFADHMPGGFTKSLGSYLVDGTFSPTPAVQDVISRTIHKWGGEPTVGINIRSIRPGTDRVAPVEWYVERMKEIHDRVPGVVFFMSLDMEETSQAVRSALPKCSIIESGKSYDYDASGITHCAAELHILAEHCDWFIGAETSCFSQIVQWMRGETYYRDDDGGAVRTKVTNNESCCEDRENLRSIDEVVRALIV